MTDKYKYQPRPAATNVNPIDFRDKFPDFDCLYQTLIQAGKSLEEKFKLLDQLKPLKAAFQAHDYEEALRIAAAMVGEPYETCH